MSEPGQFLDAGRIRERRLAAGMSQRQLANALGVSSDLVLRLERGQSHASLPLHRAFALSEALGTTLEALLARRTAAARAGLRAAHERDSDTLHAVLVELNQVVGRDELAEALGWPLDRLHAAARGLRDMLAESGVYLQSTWGLRLRADPNRLPDDVIAKVERAGTAKRGLNLSTAGLLRQVAQGKIDAAWERNASNPQRVALSALLRMGLVKKTARGFALTVDAVFSLRRPVDRLQQC